ncbi:flagella synthesis protein FlgN [Motilimonas eburnea]|uniref:flagella synthesis protein FlgN n=1 Tax=Motilimonas eburnea TaxID=1737488 RepID=UPI001E65BF81|nr:flagellar protein FlgN [Motilimonas eburnea]MCE2571568.1 flagellar protein FlgN [Motilimonas eburnea]
MTVTITQLLEQQLTHTQSLVDLINEEYETLINRNPERLDQLVQQKQTLLQQVEAQDKHIQAHPDAAQLGDESNTEIQALLSEIKTAFNTCQQQNAINGEIIEMSLRTTKHLTSVLNQAKAANSLTYNAKGKTQGGSALGKGIKA